VIGIYGGKIQVLNQKSLEAKVEKLQYRLSG